MNLFKGLCIAAATLLIAAPAALNAADASLFQVSKAAYGAPGQTIDVTDKVKAAVKDDKLSIAATNVNFTDPAVGKGKTLDVQVKYKGKDLSFKCGENQTLTIDKAKLDKACEAAPSCGAGCGK